MTRGVGSGAVPPTTRPLESTSCTIPRAGAIATQSGGTPRLSSPRMAWIRACRSPCSLSSSWCSTARTSPQAARAIAMATIAVAMAVMRTRTVCSRLLIGHQPVTDAAHRLEGAPVERDVDLAPEVADVDLDHVGFAVEVGTPDGVEQLGLGLDLAGPLHQRLEQFELASGERDRLAVALAGPRRRVETKVADLEHRPAACDTPRSRSCPAAGCRARWRRSPARERATARRGRHGRPRP